MCLSQLNHTITLAIIELFGQSLCDAVDSIVQSPVKHLDEEWKFLQKLAVPMVAEAMGVRCLDSATAAVAYLGFDITVVAAYRESSTVVLLKLLGIRIKVVAKKGFALCPLRMSGYAEISVSIYYERANHYTDDDLHCWSVEPS